MLPASDNEDLCRVGPGTPMGDLMRQYWVPAMLSEELSRPNCAPVQVLLLGERLIGFRDSSGRVGLLAESCPHRGASLYYGRNEECGLRCVYHGWKFDVSGECVDMPSEPPDSNFKAKVRAAAYPCRERGGVVWAYLGPRAEPPPLPDLEANMLPDGESDAFAAQRECNWVQSLEGDIDTAHLGFLHMGAVDPSTTQPGTFRHYTVKDRAPRYAVLDTAYGAMYGAYRPAGDGALYWRIAHFLFPFYAMIPTGLLGVQRISRAWVPMDDEHTMFFHFQPTARDGDPVRHAQMAGVNIRVLQGSLLPRSTGWYGRFRLAANEGNDYLIDRDVQRQGNYTGIRGVHIEDQAVTESMGPIFDRTREHLASSDAMVIRVRRRLLAAARALAERGTTPPGVDHPGVYRQRSGGVILPSEADWIEATHELRQAFMEHSELDLSVVGDPV